MKDVAWPLGLTVPRPTPVQKLSWEFSAHHTNKALPKGMRCVWPTIFLYRRLPEKN